MSSIKNIPYFFGFLCAVLTFAMPSQSGAAGDADYVKAKGCYDDIKGNPVKQKAAAEWEKCIGLFEGAAEKHRGDDIGAKSLYSTARLKRELYGKLHSESDLNNAIGLYNRVIREYPKHPLADDALYQIGSLRHDPLKQDDRARHAFEYLLEHYPDGDMAAPARKALESLSGSGPGAGTSGAAVSGAAVGETGAAGDIEETSVGVEDEEIKETDIKGEKAKGKFEEDVAGRFDTAMLESVDIKDADFSTVVGLKFSQAVAYSLKFTPTGVRTKSPPRLDALFTYTKLAKALAKELAVRSPYLTGIRLKKDLLSGDVRLIFMMVPGSTYEVIPEGEQVTFRFRRADDRPSGGMTPGGDKSGVVKKGGKKKALTIVIDPGHGGPDKGAVGPTGTMEKNVTLVISKRLADELKKKLGARVFLTRTTDREATLEERSEFAVKKKADLFISIHTNASKSRKARGIETYYLNNATDDAAARLAARENRGASRKLSEVEHILSTMLQNYDAAESRNLAADVQTSVSKRITKRYPGVPSRGVRSALFYVLVGAKCPSVLVETSFISNPTDEKRLKDRNYQGQLVIGITQGVRKYTELQDKRMVSL